jgi:CRP/FNR family transcriptional regulator
MKAKYYAATQTVDEARHVGAYDRFVFMPIWPRARDDGSHGTEAMEGMGGPPARAPALRAARGFSLFRRASDVTESVAMACPPDAAAPAAMTFETPSRRGGCRLCPTRRVCAGRSLNDEQLERLSDHFLTSRVLERGEHLFRASDAADGCYVVRSGVFKTTALSAGGNETVTGFYYPGELIGFAGEASGSHEESAVALCPSTACQLKLASLPRLFELGEAGSSLMRLLAERERHDRRMEINLRQSKAQARIAGFFVLLGERLAPLGYTPEKLPMPMSRTDLANHLGMTLECLSRVLGQLKRAGVIRAERNIVCVDRSAELANLAYHLS